ncbi:thioredoxin [Alkalihalophilus pseudofirmus OF4]|uniref:Thioredoxin n=1 Tax=Alkalihalophilus pseudofirmus (strain ATCC BAA-2126 / JCM 17055 / OF4) TaxID=398511 RepID=D3G0P0_ALKPO|nr:MULTISPECIES: TlpA disulfide reductase family protein [Alkalihalophilus]ADC51202.1 thioredoxin [Alkalihalophilus pseudofirmus OF4]MED1601791.1 TlpA disulfide reductase family protein [Alkalihalophilus marmarensis]
MNSTAPDFTLPALNGTESLTLGSLKGKVVLLTFFTTWCPDSKKDILEKQALFQSMNRDDVKMIFVHVTGRDSSVDLSKWQEEMQLTLPVYMDLGTKTYDAYRCMGVPTTVLIDKDQSIKGLYNDKARMIDIIKGLGGLL